MRLAAQHSWLFDCLELQPVHLNMGGLHIRHRSGNLLDTSTLQQHSQAQVCIKDLSFNDDGQLTWE